MIHRIAVALMVWGLIVQPLMAAMPVFIPVDSSASVVELAGSDLMAAHHATSGAESPVAPCHETADIAPATIAPATMECADCDDACASGMCAASCLAASPALIAQTQAGVLQRRAIRLANNSDALVQGLVSRIFHPPKQA